MHKFFKRKTFIVHIKKAERKISIWNKTVHNRNNRSKCCIFFILQYDVKLILKGRKKRVQGRGDFLWEGRTLKIAGFNFFITKNLVFKLFIYVSFIYSWPHQLERTAMLLFIIFCLKMRTWNVNVWIFIYIGVLRIKWGMSFCFEPQQ